MNEIPSQSKRKASTESTRARAASAVRTAQGGFGSPLAMASGGAGEVSRRAAATPPAELSAAPVPQRTTGSSGATES